MNITNRNHITYPDENMIRPWMDAFLRAKQVENLSQRTIEFYTWRLKQVNKFLSSIGIYFIDQISEDVIRQYFIYLKETGHNPGGIAASFRTIKCFLRWYENEVEPEDWKNPIRKIKAPKVDIAPIEGVKLVDLKALLDASKGKDFTDLRDYALFLFLLDTGARAGELLAINTEDVDLIDGSVLIRRGKSRKPRTVFLSENPRKALRRYLKVRQSQTTALWITSNNGNRLTYDGLNMILRRKCEKANIEKVSCHDFRRTFALESLRNGADIYSLQKLMGHADLQVLRRYLAQNNDDLSNAHRKSSPVSNWEL